MISISVNDLVPSTFIVHILNKGFVDLNYRLKVSNIYKFIYSVGKSLNRNGYNVKLLISPGDVEKFVSRPGSEFSLSDDGYVTLSNKINIMDFIERYSINISKYLLIELNKRRNYKKLVS